MGTRSIDRGDSVPMYLAYDLPFLGHSSSHLWCMSCSPIDDENYNYDDNVVGGGNW